MAFLEFKPTSTLYQYCSESGFRSVLKSKAIWSTDLGAANDPREIKLGSKHFLEAVEFVQMNDYANDAGAHLRKMFDRLRSAAIRQQFFCSCFTTLRDSLPMWREYGSNYSGVAIGFRPTAITSLPGRIQKVKYLNSETSEDFRRVARDIVSNFDPQHGENDIHYWATASSAMLAAMTALKHNSWEYEKEIRFVFAQVMQEPSANIPVSQFDDRTEVFWKRPMSRPRGNAVVEYFEFPFGIRKNGKHDPTRAISEVVLGPRCPVSVGSLKILLDELDYRDVKIAKSECEVRA